jgi:hypothetical protein
MVFDSTTVVANNLIVDNSAWVVGGAYLLGGWFLNNTLVGNTAEWAVGHLYAQQYDGSLQGIHNNTFSGSPNGGGLLISGMEPGPIFSYNHIWGNQPVDFLNENLDNFDPDPRNWLASQGNITGDPRFVDPATGNFRLTQDSPCLNVGNPDFTDDLTPTDLDGNTRIVGKRVDIGAYESAYLPSILADAGEDQEVTVGTLVTLDGSGSLFPDPNNPKRLYLWDQITGPSVTLANPLTATPTFTPTQVAVYRFDLIVYDGKKASQPDEVIVTVIEDPNSPEE